MTIDKIIIGILSLGGMAFTYWFFLMKKEKEVAVSDSVNIVVDGGYTPGVISVSAGKTSQLDFIRKDPSSCLEEVVIPEFKVRKYLPLNKKTSISITPKRAGQYEISCGMNMFHGKIIVT